eukprot:5568309-Prymnesium_polylepis.1
MACHGLRRRCVRVRVRDRELAASVLSMCASRHVACRLLHYYSTPQPCPAGSSSSLAVGANTAAREAVSGGVWRRTG